MPDTASDTTTGYQVLARRYRSKTFGEVVGQESIAETLERAIDRGRTAHAYLFCGTRGVGKTSMARIFAQALNVSEEQAEEVAVGDAILRGEDMDVVEIDGASNNGVQDARDLIANASIRPARSPFKIYIIDEVHMLSNAAFNALLKTMEEPPSHVKFILCTTEPHKVLPTIQSRCQRFDFRPISVARIAEHLTAVLGSESIEADEAVVLRVARLANGSMRDGLSILERVVAAADGRLDAVLLERVLGVPPEDIVKDVASAIGAGDPAATLRAMAALLAEGLAPERALDGIAERFRLLLAARVCGDDPALLGTGSEESAALVEESSAFEAEQLVHMIALCDAAGGRVRVSASPRAILDAAVTRMALSERFARAASLLAGDVAVSSTASSKKKSLKAADSRRPAPPARRVSPPAAESPSATAPTRVRESGAGNVETKSVDPVGADQGPWSTLCAAAETPKQRAMLEDFEFDRMEGGRLRLRKRVDASPSAGWTMQKPQGLADLASSAFGRRIEIEFVETAEPTTQSSGEVAADVNDHPLVREAVDLFGAHVVQVRRTEQPVKDGDSAVTPEEQG
ncbi:MAG: DNA polymerase III subunit gamma/tau [Phycisphaerales bacterium]|jgi:DNA polymerase-3 subunit gamma/tau|nr:DNA polymerase III subunit gamma/tau [Phycisphaerales bacterium]